MKWLICNGRVERFGELTSFRIGLVSEGPVTEDDYEDLLKLIESARPVALSETVEE